MRLAGIEAGGTKCIAAVADGNGRLIARTSVPTRDAETTMAACAAFLQAHGPLAGIGIASFGPLEVDPTNPDHGRFAATPKPGWTGASWVDALARLDAPILCDTDVNGAALAEALTIGESTLAYVTVGTGIGVGVVRAGQLLGGRGHLEGGHIAVARDPVRDPFAGCCPWHGDCLEGLASGTAISARWGEGLDAPRCPPERLELIADYLGQFCAALVLLHQPHRLVLGGGVMKAAGLWPALRAATVQRLGGYVPGLESGLASYLVPPSLGDQAGITGALLLAARAAAR